MKGLYIHIPFCVKKCEYCDFVSFPGQEERFEGYIDALIAEMAEYCGAAVDTVFIGGGTPSVLPPQLIAKLCGAVKDNFNIARDYEWTAEVNPGTLTDEKIQAMLDGGINRISLGVQSFNDRELKAAGRIHTAQTAYDTVLKLNNAGFCNISIDLMESLPYQTAESFKWSLETAVSLPIKHISVYSLIIEDGTPIKEKYDKGIYTMPDEDSDRELYHYTKSFLAEHGFKRYEISNYAMPDCESRHNLKYWNCDEYIGLGLAAASYLGRVRYSNTCDLSEYIAGNYRSGEKEILTREDMMGELMMLGLRKTEGVSAAEFKRRFGCAVESIYGAKLEKFISLGALERAGDYYRLTERGLDVANTVMCEFLNL
ncbi:MAG: radical SAM family heme chaperone HemW [Candidatus Ornithomonoglobus sp.]